MRFEHPKLPMILAAEGTEQFLQHEIVEAGHLAMVLVDGRLTETISPGPFAYRRGMGRLKILHIDLREQVVDVAGQEIMTADKVTLRINAVSATVTTSRILTRTVMGGLDRSK